MMEWRRGALRDANGGGTGHRVSRYEVQMVMATMYLVLSKFRSRRRHKTCSTATYELASFQAMSVKEYSA